MSVISSAGSWRELKLLCGCGVTLAGLRLVRAGGRRIRGAAPKS